MAKRESINLPGMAHGAPIPMGSKIGNTVYSSGIGGRDQQKNVMPDDPAEQARCMFDNVRQFMEIAGGTPDDIIRKLNEASVKALKDPGLVDRFRGAGAEPVGNTPQQYTAEIKREFDKMRTLVKQQNIKLDQ